MNPLKTNLASTITMLALLTLPSAVMADSFSGKLNGHGCAHAGMTCPVDRLDPHVALESDFVLQKSDGDYYFLTDMPMSVKRRYALAVVKVDGKLNEKYHAIDVNEFRVKKGDSYKLMWSKAMQKKERESLEDAGLPFFYP